jgi:uncharacterized integral membrane protein (TIGR00697 family)
MQKAIESKQGFSPMFLITSVLFVSCLLISNIIAGKLASFSGFVLPAAVILFPITYIFGDVLTEVYGFRRSRLVIWLGFAVNALMVLIFYIVIILPYPDFWKGQDAYSLVLGTTPKILVASLIGYFFGEFLNSMVLSRLKVITEGRLLWLRTIGSTVIGEGVDTIIFITVVFAGTLAGSQLWNMILLQYLWKVLYEVLLTPLTYGIVGWMKRKEGIDVYDTGIKYNPFRIKD